jgi:hypothetical protein
MKPNPNQPRGVVASGDDPTDRDLAALGLLTTVPVGACWLPVRHS